jgi:hypothetical protein
MDDIIEPTIDYDFTKLYFGPPSSLAGGAYFTRLMYNTNKPIFIQTPKSLTKQGFIKSGKKIYTDLMFDNNDTVFINWIENLEARCQELIFAKRETWFETKLEKDDIEGAFTSPFKIFKSGKYYLLRVNVKPNIKIYDEKDQVLSIESITNDKPIICILEIQGLKFTSRNFQIEIELKQSMIVSPDPFLDECFIKKPIKKQQTQKIKEEEKKEQEVEEEEEEEVEVEEEQINKNISFDLDNLINQSAQHLAKNKVDSSLEINNETNNINNKNISPIDLEETFENPKPLEINNQNKNQNLFGLEEADIDFTNLLDVNDLPPQAEELEVEVEDPNILKEIDLSSTLDNSLETLQLKKPNQVFYEIYQKARERAKEAKKNAILAYLEMKNIKKTYMLDDIDESDNEFDEFASRDSSSEMSDTESLEEE